MFSVNRKSQSGFSLVELMVVVAIIGVLASIAVPSINKYLAKARQSEAKTNLSSLYTSEKAFYAEYTAYHAAFSAIGYTPEGKLRYNLGFGANTGNAGAANGFTTAVTNPSWINTSTYCIPNGGTMTTARPCTMLNGATGAQPTNLATSYAVNSATGVFTAGATAVIHSSGANDVWSINQNKELTNVTNGIP
ncbi:type IV pilin protein [Bdellovibrio bacteriovorus]|uniref:type IV pilin protein n=1 Tax=Bdellovibrio bacteriovorus TaxID=959 RepID=UPI0035A60192